MHLFNNSLLYNKSQWLGACLPKEKMQEIQGILGRLVGIFHIDHTMQQEIQITSHISNP